MATTKTLVAKKIAQQWLDRVLAPEYRLEILWSPNGIHKLLPFLRNLRDKTHKLSVPDLGIKDEGDRICIWSSDHEKLKQLNTWLESRGYETTGVW